MLATLYQGEDSHAPTRREYFPPPHPPPPRRLSRPYRPDQSAVLPIFAHPDPTPPRHPAASPAAVAIISARAIWVTSNFRPSRSNSPRRSISEGSPLAPIPTLTTP